MTRSSLGKVYEAGEVVVRQGDAGKCMFVIQEGSLEVVRDDGTAEVRVGVLDAGDFFGEMSLFERETRAATVRALERVRVLTIDRRTLMRRVHEDPSLAFNLLRTMCRRIRILDEELHRTRARLTQGNGGETKDVSERP